MASNEGLLEQIRLQEGRLFQNEAVVSLFLDVKCVVLDYICSVLRVTPDAELHGVLLDHVAWPPSIAQCLMDSLAALEPAGAQGHDHHGALFYETVKVYWKLLYPLENVVVVRPKIEMLLRGLVRRLVTLECVKNKSLLNIQPLGQDFVVRDAFRRVLCNDCMVVFNAATGELRNVDMPQSLMPQSLPQSLMPQTSTPQKQAEDANEIDVNDIVDDESVVIDAAESIGPDDSASRAFSLGPRPKGATSVLGPIDAGDADATSSAAPSRVASMAPSRVASRAPPMRAPSQAPSRVMLEAAEGDGSSKTMVSNNGAKKIMNVKRIHISNLDD